MKHIMKILASDWDGTLNHGGVSEADRAAIARFQAAGHRFGLVTGRTPRFIQSDLYRHMGGVRLDFFVYATGGLILDGSGEELYCSPIDGATAREILALARQWKLSHISFSDAEEAVVSESEWMARFYEDSEAGVIVSRDPEPALRRGRIYNFVIIVEDDALREPFLAALQKQLGGRAALHNNRGVIDISGPGSSKTDGLRRLNRQLHGELYPIGDGQNDVGMIRTFGGFAMADGCEEARRGARWVVGSVAEAVDILLGQAAGA